MKTKQIITTMAMLAVMAGFTAQVRAAEEKEDAITMDQVPKAVKKALAKYASEAEVKGIEIADQDGKKVFEFDIEQGAHKYEAAFSKKGKFMGTEEDVELSAMPDAVQKALADLGAGGKLSGFEKAVDADNKVTFEADLDKDGKKSEVAVDKNGKVASQAAEKGGDEEKDDKD